MRLQNFNCYQVLHNVAYVATHLSLMNVYRIQTVQMTYGNVLFLSTLENVLNVLIWILCLLRCLNYLNEPDLNSFYIILSPSLQEYNYKFVGDLVTCRSNDTAPIWLYATIW